MTTAINGTSAYAATNQSNVKKSGFDSLGQGDFLRLLTVQMQQQDPMDPVDNKDMLAQMAQFSTLSATTEMGDTLKAIAAKLDLVLGGQTPPPAKDGQNPAQTDTTVPQE